MTNDELSPRLFLITPPIADRDRIASVLAATLNSGDAACVLLELGPLSAGEASKIARGLAPSVQSRGAAFLTRDPQMAALCGLDGAHIAARSEAFETELAGAVASLKPERIVGAGAITQKHQAMMAGELGVDYVMFGEPEPDRPEGSLEDTLEWVSWWSEIFTTPCVAYAGRLDAVAPLAAAGADFIALGDAVWTCPSGPERAWAEAGRILRSVGAQGR